MAIYYYFFTSLIDYTMDWPFYENMLFYLFFIFTFFILRTTLQRCKCYLKLYYWYCCYCYYCSSFLFCLFSGCREDHVSSQWTADLTCESSSRNDDKTCLKFQFPEHHAMSA